MDTVHAVDAGVVMCGLFGDTPQRLPEVRRVISVGAAVKDRELRNKITCITCWRAVKRRFGDEVRREITARNIPTASQSGGAS